MKPFYLLLTNVFMFFSVFFCAKAVPYEAGKNGYPDRLRREDSFLGVHFDFHAGPEDTQIGAGVTPEMVETIIQKVHPDFIQIDCKGHPGCSSYPTKVGNQAGGFVKDTLRIWREVTAKYGVSLYMHYSGVFDVKAMADHPEWAAMPPKKLPDSPPWAGSYEQKASVFGPYVDKLMIPQLKELRNEYGVDGFWIDGECWATVPDYNPQVIEQFTQQTGITDIPAGPQDSHWYEWTQFHREGFRAYLRHYTDVLHRDCPGVQITSNWAFSSMMPEPVTVELDYLSGDYSMQDSIREARWQARCLQHQEKPWDLMAWGFASQWDALKWRTAKTAEQLKREAAMVLSTGGGFQCYYTQRRDGSVRLYEMDVMGEVAQFCRARQKYCHRAESVPQIGLFYNTAALYRNADVLFSPSAPVIPIRGILNVLLDGQFQVEVVMDHQLKGQSSKYPVIVFPEWDYVDSEIQAELIDYVCNGGNLLVIGPKSTELFQEPLGLKKLEQVGKQIRRLHFNKGRGGMNAEMGLASFVSDVQTKGTLTYDEYPPKEEWPAGSIRTLGKGKIAGIYANLGRTYQNETNTVFRDYISAMIKELLPNPLVEINGSSRVDVVINRIQLDGKSRLAINLVNTAGPHRDKHVYTFDNIPSVGPLSMRIRLDQKPERIVRQPGDESMSFNYHDGIAEILVPSVKIHDIYIVY